LIKSSDPNFPDAEIAVLGKKSVNDAGEPTFNINVYGKGIFAQQKYADIVYSLTQNKIDRNKLGKTSITNPFGKLSDSEANAPGTADGVAENSHKTYTLEYKGSEADLSNDFGLLVSAHTGMDLRTISGNIKNKDLAVIIKSIGNSVIKNAVVVGPVGDGIIGIKTNGDKEIMEFGKQADNEAVPAKSVITSYGYEIMTKNGNPELDKVKALQFKEGTA